MSKFFRVETFEEAFLHRYGKEVTVYRRINAEDKKIIDVEVQIKFKGDTFTLHEFLEDDATKYTLVNVEGKEYKYPRYLDAEVFVADKIGEIVYGKHK